MKEALIQIRDSISNLRCSYTHDMVGLRTRMRDAELMLATTIASHHKAAAERRQLCNVLEFEAQALDMGLDLTVGAVVEQLKDSTMTLGRRMKTLAEHSSNQLQQAAEERTRIEEKNQALDAHLHSVGKGLVHLRGALSDMLATDDLSRQCVQQLHDAATLVTSVSTHRDADIHSQLAALNAQSAVLDEVATTLHSSSNSVRMGDGGSLVTSPVQMVHIRSEDDSGSFTPAQPRGSSVSPVQQLFRSGGASPVMERSSDSMIAPPEENENDNGNALLERMESFLVSTEKRVADLLSPSSQNRDVTIRARGPDASSCDTIFTRKVCTRVFRMWAEGIRRICSERDEERVAKLRQLAGRKLNMQKSMGSWNEGLKAARAALASAESMQASKSDMLAAASFAAWAVRDTSSDRETLSRLQGLQKSERRRVAF